MMKKIWKSIVALAAFVWLVGPRVSPLQAAPKAAPMRAAAADARNNVKMIWDYKVQLGLTDPQVAGIKQAINDFEREVLRLRSKLQVVELDIQDLIQKKGDMTAIKEKLSESAGLQVDLRFADIETARKIDSILSPEQVEKWKSIQQKEAARKAPKP